MFFRTIFPCFLFAGALASAAAEPLSLSLQQAIQTALAHNPDLHLAALGLDGAGAAVLTAGAAPNPTLTLQSFNLNPAEGLGAGSLRGKAADSTLRLDQLLERGGKRGLRVNAARSLEQAASSDVGEARRQLRLMVSLAYYDLLAARDKLLITRESADLFDGTVAAARKRQQAGDLAPADVARAQVDALRARNDIVQAESDLFTLRHGLALLMGQDGPGTEPSEPSDPWPADPAPAVPGGMRPDLLAAQARVEAAATAHRLALASRSADVSIGIQAEHFPASAAHPQGSGNSFGIALQIPLMLRYAYQGEIRAADVARDIAQENLDRLRALARSEALVSAEHVRAARERLRRDDGELLLAAKKSADAAEFAFRHGALGIMDLLDVRRSYRSAQLEALAARADFAKSLAAAQAAATEGQP